MDDPLVIAVMITGKHPDRIPLAQAAIAAFELQSYERKQLVILNTGSTRLTDEIDPRPGVYETFAPHWTLTALGTLRNYALDIIADRFPADAWVIQWDDDDWYHHQRIALQVAAAREDNFQHPVTLRRQVRYCFATNTAFAHDAQETAWGIHGTILHPQSEMRYEEVPKHEDSRFLKRFRRVTICENIPQLYIRFVHGRNTFDERHIMGKLAGRHDEWHLDIDTESYLTETLNQHYSKQLHTFTSSV